MNTRTNQTASYRAGYQAGRDGRDPVIPRHYRDAENYWAGYSDGGNAPRHNPNAEPLMRHSEASS